VPQRRASALPGCLASPRSSASWRASAPHSAPTSTLLAALRPPSRSPFAGWGERRSTLRCCCCLPRSPSRLGSRSAPFPRSSIVASTWAWADRIESQRPSYGQSSERARAGMSFAISRQDGSSWITTRMPALSRKERQPTTSFSLSCSKPPSTVGGTSDTSMPKSEPENVCHREIRSKACRRPRHKQEFFAGRSPEAMQERRSVLTPDRLPVPADERKLAVRAETPLSHAGDPICLFSGGLAAAEPRAFEGLADRRALDAQAAGRFADVAPASARTGASSVARTSLSPSPGPKKQPAG
jgi:hypothetical protein